MLLRTKREDELWDKYYKENDPNKKDEILTELKKIDEEKTKNVKDFFAH